MKNIFKRLLPYVMINGIICAIMGAIIGKTYVNIKNTKNKIGHDEEVFKDFLKHMTEVCPNKVLLEDLEKDMCEEDELIEPYE